MKMLSVGGNSWQASAEFGVLDWSEFAVFSGHSQEMPAITFTYRGRASSSLGASRQIRVAGINDVSGRQCKSCGSHACREQTTSRERMHTKGDGPTWVANETAIALETHATVLWSGGKAS